MCVPLGFTPFDFLGPQPGLYWLFDALPLCPPCPPPAMTPPVPAAIRATVSSVAIVRDFTWNPFVREVAAFATALVLILSRSKALASALSLRSRSSTRLRSSGRPSSWKWLIDPPIGIAFSLLYERARRFLTGLNKEGPALAGPSRVTQ